MTPERILRALGVVESYPLDAGRPQEPARAEEHDGAGCSRAGRSACAAQLAGIGRPRPARAAETIRIGFPTPVTGPFGAEAKDQIKFAELAVKPVQREAGGLDGRMAELLVRDDKLNPGEAATRTLELIEKDRAHFIVGALSSAVQLSVNEITRSRKVLYVSISQSDTINEAKDFSRTPSTRP